MPTTVLRLDPDPPEPAAIRRAAEVLRGGGLVAFPTETVYGLGANALDRAAVTRIFVAKGRPANNPIIVHVATLEAARQLVTDWPEAAQRLAERHWPGPLTLILPRRPWVPDEVTAGGPTVALRMPAHPVALALLAEAELPVAAPSANRSSRLSPTRAEHVLHDLEGRIELILDAGPTPGGLESSVLDLTTVPPRLLRPGLIAPSDIEAIIGPVQRGLPAPGSLLRSPGMLPRHYAPRTPLECVANGRRRVEELAAARLRIGWVTFAEPPVGLPSVFAVVMPRDPAGYSARLYAVLHDLDAADVDRIIVDQPPSGDDWLAVRDRLRRASQGPATDEPG
jgi:L-threonylcarbamoyladenylate synthase